MSYEGYEQHICAHGHYFVNHDIYNFSSEKPKCSCGAESAWVNHVDDTNCDRHGYIPVELFRKHSAGVFIPPTEQEAEEIRTYVNGEYQEVFIATNIVVILPEIEHLCNQDSMFCSGAGNTYSKFPQSNMCI